MLFYRNSHWCVGFICLTSQRIFILDCNYFKHNRLFEACPDSAFKPSLTKCPKFDDESLSSSDFSHEDCTDGNSRSDLFNETEFFDFSEHSNFTSSSDFNPLLEVPYVTSFINDIEFDSEFANLNANDTNSNEIDEEINNFLDEFLKLMISKRLIHFLIKF